MDFSELLEVVDNLPDDDLERLKAHIAQREHINHKPQTAEEWKTTINAALDAFWGDSSQEEMQEIFDAMRLKSPTSKKGL